MLTRPGVDKAEAYAYDAGAKYNEAKAEAKLLTHVSVLISTSALRFT